LCDIRKEVCAMAKKAPVKKSSKKTTKKTTKKAK